MRKQSELITRLREYIVPEIFVPYLVKTILPEKDNPALLPVSTEPEPVKLGWQFEARDFAAEINNQSDPHRALCHRIAPVIRAALEERWPPPMDKAPVCDIETSMEYFEDMAFGCGWSWEIFPHLELFVVRLIIHA